ncbi:peptidoglycan DD-metalloendopeptidase family protein [Halomicronema hongdechloris]|nr:peptidoglycan DD-metalloendopeptidase family protein [Halomicronema hongdechloris]
MPRSTEALAATLPAEYSAAALGTSAPDATASSPTLSQQAVYHTVEAGESLWHIAHLHQVDVKALKQANSMAPDHTLQVGQVLRVPVEAASPEAAAVESPVHLAVQLPDSAASSSVKLSVGGSVEAAPVESASAPTTATIAMAEAEAATASSDASMPAGQQTMASLVSRQQSATKPAEAPGGAAAEPAAVDQAGTLTSDSTVEAHPEERSGSSEVAAYRVQAGDTLSHIASKQGVSKDMLARANGLSDPDKIVVGDTLHLPESETLPARSAAAPPEASQPRSAEIAAIPASQLTIDAAVPAPGSTAQLGQSHSRQAPGHLVSPVTAAVEEGTLEQTTGPETPSQLPRSVTLSTDSSSTDASVANLLAEVRSLQQSDTKEVIAAHPGQQVTEQSATEPSTAGSNHAVIEEKDVVSSPSERPLGVAERELLAAAPLGSEIYAPINRSSVGRQVSPDMPLLPGPEEYLPEAPNRFDGYTWPARGTLTSGYGWRWGRMHRGIDVAGPVGTPIVAAADGTVERAGWNSGGYGNLVDIRHPDGSMTRYAHNSRLLVRTGQQVRQGQQIAEMGSTGRSTGPHLHFEIHLPGQGTVNPIAHLPSR